MAEQVGLRFFSKDKSRGARQAADIQDGVLDAIRRIQRGKLTAVEEPRRTLRVDARTERIEYILADIANQEIVYPVAVDIACASDVIAEQLRRVFAFDQITKAARRNAFKADIAVSRSVSGVESREVGPPAKDQIGLACIGGGDDLIRADDEIVDPVAADVADDLNRNARPVQRVAAKQAIADRGRQVDHVDRIIVDIIPAVRTLKRIDAAKEDIGFARFKGVVHPAGARRADQEIGDPVAVNVAAADRVAQLALGADPAKAAVDTVA